MSPTISSDKFRLTVEPLMSVTFFIVGLGGPLTDLVMRQGCAVLNRDPANCTNDDEVHRMASTFSELRIILETLPGCIMTLFTGPWSNTNGRKPLLILSLTGMMLSLFFLAYLSTLTTIHPYCLLLACGPLVLTGGPISVILIAMTYMVDITTTETRTLRLAILNWTSFLVGVLTNFVAPWFKTVGYPTGYGITAIMVMVVLIYTIFILPESVVVDKEKKTSLFTVEHLRVSCKSFFRTRPNHVRGIVWCLALSSALGLLQGIGENEVQYLSLIKKFGWDLSEYSAYNAFTKTIAAFAALGAVYIGTSVLKMDELICIVFTVAASLTSSVLTVVFAQPVAFWIVTQLKCFTGCMAPLSRGYVSKLVPHDEVVNILSFMGSIDGFMPQLGAMMYSNFYNWSVEYDAFGFYNLSTLLTGVSAFSVIVAMILRWKAVGRENDEAKQDLESSRNVKVYDSKESTSI